VAPNNLKPPHFLHFALCQWKVILADLLVDVNGRAFPLVKVVHVNQLPIALRAERRSDGFYAVGDHVFMAWVWNILLTSEPVGWPVASVIGMAGWDILV